MSLRTLVIRAAAAALALGLAAAPGPARAFQASCPVPDGTTFGGCESRFTLAASLGQLAGTGSELVFDYPGGQKFKISELSWDMTNVAIAGVQGSIGFGRRVRANLGVWSSLTGGVGNMIDRDWWPRNEAIAAAMVSRAANEQDYWTHESRHSDVSVDRAVIIDLNLAVSAWRSGSFAVQGVLGYKQDALTWSARGGTFLYSFDQFRDTAGRFRDEEVIKYEQVYRIPYLGVGASWSRPNFMVEAHLLASTLVSAEDTDHHRLRDTVFTGTFSGGTFVGAGVSASWAFAPLWYARASFEAQALSNLTGDVVMDAPEGRSRFENGGGIALDATLLSVEAGLRY